MRELPVIESSREVEFILTSNSVTTERNRLTSWDNPAQRLNKPGSVAQSSKNSITLGPFGLVTKILKLFFAFLAKLSYTLFKLGYEIAKFVTRRLSSIRRSLFVADWARKKL
jgi:hypothetical protein